MTEVDDTAPCPALLHERDPPMPPDHPDEELVVVLRRAAQGLTRRRGIRDLEETLRQIVESAVETVPGVDAGSISMARSGRIETRAPTSDAIGRLDAAQSELNEGPCISAIEDPPASGIVVAHDLAGAYDAARWPRYSPMVVEAGYRALISTQLTTDESGLHAALNLYSSVPDTFDEATRTTAGLFGVQAAVLLHGTDTASHLERALDSRDLIGQAKGVLMERFTVDDDAAFRMLVTSSQDTNMKLVLVAQWVVQSATSRQASVAGEN